MLYLTKARVVSCNEPGKDSLQVRILPNQISVEDNSLLPWYAPLIKGQVIKCKSEIIDGKENAESVWVVTNDEFNTGYVLDVCNEQASTIDGDMVGSIDYKSLFSHVSRLGLNTDKFKYEDLKVIFSSFTEDGGVIELYNFRTGDLFIINSSGAALALNQEMAVLRVGSPEGKRSIISLTPGEINIKANHIHLDGQTVTIGHHGMKVAMLPEGAQAIAVNGQAILAAENINA